ncbi:MAG: DUF1800 family protein [Planctomycetota bacterium]
MGILHRYLAALAFGAAVSAASPLLAADPEFRRADANADTMGDLSDPIVILDHLFAGAPLLCRDAADSNDDGAIDISDAVTVLFYLFNGGAPPPSPGPLACGPDPTLDSLECHVAQCGGADPLAEQAGHLLARATFGARPGQVEEVLALGIPAWIDQQIVGFDDTANSTLMARKGQLTQIYPRTADSEHLFKGSTFRYAKGTAPLPSDWMLPGFDDSGWDLGITPFRYGFSFGGTQLNDMFGGYTSLAIRDTFHVTATDLLDPAALRIDYDDGFVAWINGVEIARNNVTGAVPTFDQTATANHQAGYPEYFPIPPGVLVAGDNVIAVHGFNRSTASSDFYLEVRVVTQTPIVGAPDREVFESKAAVQQWPYFLARYSENDFLNMLALFWDNHLTTDWDKTRDFIRAQRDRANVRVIETRQANVEASTVEAEEFEFFRENALGNFGDLLLFSASNPSMLIYLDSVLNFSGQPNENYAREILELFGLGVDNGYTQADVEEVARCFTGWGVDKVPYESVLPYPDRVTTPRTELSDEQMLITSWIDIGETWSYFKGTAEPAPGPLGEATTAWAAVGFDDSTWLQGPTGIGYGDGDDATLITDMQNNYSSIYLRKSFTVTDIHEGGRLELHVRYDDGCVVYLNGVEVGRATQMNGTGTPPPFDALSGNHEVTGTPLLLDLETRRELLVVGENVLAIQIHNQALGSNDLSVIPHLYTWQPGPGFIEIEDIQGEWQFRFDPARHDTDPKTIFAGTPYELQIPAGRTGASGVLDGIDVIDAIVAHPGTAEFICVKLLGLLVTDEIDLASVHDLSAPLEYRALLADAIGAWNSTVPKGNIETVIRAILTSDTLDSPFWGERARRAKVKTPFEHIASTVRALDATVTGRSFTTRISRMGQSLFDRDDPDGYAERGDSWIGTTSLLERINFVREVAENQTPNSFSWDALAFIQANGAVSAVEIIDLFDDLLYQGTLNGTERLLLQRFAEIEPTSGAVVPFDPAAGDYESRVERLIGMLFSLPRWCFQ